MLIALEGVDGSGKRTLAQALTTEWTRIGMSVHTLSFPRYGTLIADIAAEALHGEHGDLAASVYAMAMMFALDRAQAQNHITTLAANHNVVILDRYVASNAAYSAARLQQGPDGPIVEWVRNLEYDRICMPQPDLQVLLDIPVEVAAERASRREQQDARTRDAYERDSGLQQRTAAAYRGLANAQFGGRWHTITPDIDATAAITWLIGDTVLRSRPARPVVSER